MKRVLVLAILLYAATAVAVPVAIDVKTPDSRDPRHVRLGDSLWIRVSSLAELRQAETAAKTPVTLWIDGRDTKLTPSALNDSTQWVRFRLERNERNRDLWSDLLYKPFAETTRDVTVSLGPGAPLQVPATSNTRVTLIKIEPNHAAAWLALLLAFVIAFVWLARRTDIVRDGKSTDPANRQPYSLGRVQMAWWFVLILAGFVAIALVSGDDASITPSLLALMGISAGTALGSAAVPKAGAAPAATASENWFYDIVKDDTGAVALHRLQMVVWTIVLGVMFISSVCRTLTMPEFSGTLLAIMGISGGTYLGFKIQGSA